MEALGQLTAGIAHNFNDLLQAIVGSLEVAQSQNMPTVSDEAITQALDTTRRAGELIAQLMIFARPNSRRTHETFTPTKAIDLAKVVSDVVSICSRTFEPRIEILTTIKPNQYAIGDSMQMEQVVLNLCINARDALAEVERNDPTIRVDLETVDVDDRSTAGDAKSGRYACLSVSDNGPGMDQETQAKIFDPFFTTKEIPGGTGLGLSTVFGIVRDHRGWIDCDSELGVGTRVSLYLPTSEAPDVLSPVTHVSATSGTETILIIEDEEMIRHTAQQMFEAHGYSTMTAADGRSGIELFDRERQYIDVVLLNQSLPGMTGRQVIKQLRRKHSLAKIIIFTGVGSDLGEFIGADGLIHKPVSMTTLMSKIRSVLDRDG
jgi:two-component system cell cycle sensor histidine kinase/response regulator CckA